MNAARPILYSFAILLFFVSLSLAQDVSSRQKRQLKTIRTTIDKAIRLYDSKKLKSSADKLNLANQQIQTLAATANSELMNLLKPEHARLTKTSELLSEKEIEVSTVEPLPEPLEDDVAPISFIRDVAPIIVKNCGRCHVNRIRGEFSAKDFESLMRSTHVSPGRADTSRLIEVIAEGDMPPNGNVDDKELVVLKLWIRQGAKYDGPATNINLNRFAEAMNNNAAARIRLQPTEPSGNETVSFGRDVAPILIENCSGCHIETRQIRGNFNMNNFARLLRGGDSGNPLVPGAPGESVIVKRLRGIDSEVMPPKKKLKKAKIAVIEKWIAEGASFDGYGSQLGIGRVAAISKAEAQTHEELSVERDKLCVKNWQLIMSDDAPDVFSNDHFRVVGSNLSDRLKTAATFSAGVREQIVDELNSNLKEPFVKGKVTIYLFERRYDLNELGIMLVGKDLPKNQLGRWGHTTVDAYASIVLSRGKPAEQIQTELTQQLAALHVAAMSRNVPRWFADGIGYATAARIFRNDETVKQWAVSASNVFNSMDQPYGFANGKLNELDTGLAGYAYVKELKRAGDLPKIMKLLHQGHKFDNAFESVFGSKPVDYFKPPKENRRR